MSNHGRTKSFSVSEFAQLDDGRRVILHQDRGFTASWKGLSSDDEVQQYETEASIRRNVLLVVLPDDEDTDDQHPWEWLARLARGRGLDVHADDLRRLPYEVVFTDAVRQLFRRS